MGLFSKKGSAALGGVKGSAIAAGGGGAAFLLETYGLSKVSFLNGPIMTPVALGLAGHLIKKKSMSLGAGVLGAAGYRLAAGLFSKPWAVNPAPVMQAPQATQARGIVDAGAMEDAFSPPALDAGYATDEYAGVDRHLDASGIVDPSDAGELVYEEALGL